jgi:hypothetical protein
MRRLLRAALGAALVLAPSAAGAAERTAAAAPAPPGSAVAVGLDGAPICTDDHAAHAERAARLAELERRLAAQPPMAPGDRTLNRAGHNYGASHRAVPPPPAPPPR